MIIFWCYLLTVCLVLNVQCLRVGDFGHYYMSSTTEDPDVWTGRWFPERPTTSSSLLPEDKYEIRNMGITNKCDDGQTNIERDYNGDYSAYLCMNPRNRLQPPRKKAPILEYENVPKLYSAQHLCMNESIHYDSDVPTFGTHRQLWPVYGEYKYLPTQRWLHSLEHGGIVGLYHPCADSRQIALFKKVIQACLWRHIITPLNTLPNDLPFTVVAWGVKLRMAHASPNAIRAFIQENALKGPEKVSRDGQFSKNLLRPAKIMSDGDDSQLCPGALAHD